MPAALTLSSVALMFLLYPLRIHYSSQCLDGEREEGCKECSKIGRNVIKSQEGRRKKGMNE